MAHSFGIPDRWLHDAEWARVGGYTIYPREGSYFIGRPSGAREYCDVDLGFDGGFANIEAAIEHARWMHDEDRETIELMNRKPVGEPVA